MLRLSKRLIFLNKARTRCYYIVRVLRWYIGVFLFMTAAEEEKALSVSKFQSVCSGNNRTYENRSSVLSENIGEMM